MQARIATEADLDVVIDTLVDSHLDYVWETWALPGPGRREKLADLVRHHVELIAFPNREIWIGADGAAVAIWQEHPSAPVDPEVAERMNEVTRSVYGNRVVVIDEVDVVLHEHRPSEPHRFLGTMGVRPERQRRGLGSAVLRPILDELDRSGTPACLETSAAGNVAFYGTLGFDVLADVDDLPGGAPETWVLWRPPASG